MSVRITTAQELDALPEWSVILDSNGIAYQKKQIGWGMLGERAVYDAVLLAAGVGPFTVIHVEGGAA